MVAERASDDVDRLAVVLDEAAALLKGQGEDHWATWLTTSRRRVLAGDAYGLVHLLSAFGAMGSLNDVLIIPADVHQTGSPDEQPANERLQALLNEIWQLARNLEREVFDR